MIQACKLLLISALLIVSACRKDVDQFIPQPEEPDAEYVSAALLGKVHSLDGASVEGAQIRFHGSATATDASGFFFLPDVLAPSLNAVLEVSSPGFFTAYQRLAWTAGAELRADISLAPKNLTASLPNSTGGQIELQQGFWLEIPPQGLEYQTGDPFDGNAQIYAYWLDPSAPDFHQLVPAGAFGLDLDGAPRYLTSFGVLALDLSDENGLPLRTVPGKTLDLHFPVPPSMSGIAPSELSLWSFDPLKGAWKESATVSLFNQYYSAKTPSGLFWNVASSKPSVTVKGWIKRPDGSPAQESQIRILDSGGSFLAQGSAQNQGQFILSVPGNTPATLQLLDLCGGEQYLQQLPSLQGNVSLNPIVLAQDEHILVKGTLLDCDEAPVSQGYIQILTGEKEVLLPLVNGSFSAWLPVCPGDIVTLIGFDLVRDFQTTPMSFPAGAQVDAGNWILCNDAPEYISFNLDGEVYFSSVPDLDVDGSLSTILESSLGVSLSFEGNAPGTYPVLLPGFSLPGLTDVNTNSLDIDLNISKFDPPGGYVIGSFNGKATELGGAERQVSGVFKLQRS